MSFKPPGEDFMNSWYPLLIALSIGLVIGLRNYMKGAQCRSREQMTGKTVLITGANCGIGKEAAIDLAKRGARVIIACRDNSKGEDALKDIKEQSKSEDVVLMQMDLESFQSVRKFAKEFKQKESRLDVLINNAGVMCHPEKKTADGMEIHMQTNYFGPFLLTQLLLEKLESSSPSRILNVTAHAYHLGELSFEDINFESREYKPGDAFAQSKLCVVLATRYLANKLKEKNITVNVYNPGVCRTDIHRHMPFKQSAVVGLAFSPFMWFLMKSAKDGAQAPVYLAIATEEKESTGKLYVECAAKDVEGMAGDDEVAARLWDVSCQITGLEKKDE